MLEPAVRTFVAVAETGSFNKASGRCYVTPTAVMKQMNRLESRLGVRLLDRGPEGITLTEAGRVFLEDAVALDRQAHDAVERARDAGGARSIMIRIGTSPQLPCRALTDLWGGLVAERPADPAVRRFKFAVVPFHDCNRLLLSRIQALGRGEESGFDLVVGERGFARKVKGIRYLPLRRWSRLTVAVPWNHPLASRSRITPEDLHGHTLMMVGEGISDVFDDLRVWLRRKHPQIRIVDEPSHCDLRWSSVVSMSRSLCRPSSISMSQAWGS